MAKLKSDRNAQAELTSSTDHLARRLVRSWHIAYYVLVGSKVRYLSNFSAAPTSASVRHRRKGVIGRAAGHLSSIYNDWLRGFCSHYPDREIGFACLPYGDIDDAVKEIRRVAKIGIKGCRSARAASAGCPMRSTAGFRV